MHLFLIWKVLVSILNVFSYTVFSHKTDFWKTNLFAFKQCYTKFLKSIMNDILAPKTMEWAASDDTNFIYFIWCHSDNPRAYINGLDQNSGPDVR